MALTITSDLIVITNGNDGTWNDIGGGSGSAAETDYFIQGTGSRSRAVSGASASRGMAVDIGAGNTLDFSVAGNEEDMLVYFWVQCYTPGLTDALSAAPGLRLRLSEGTTPTADFAEWDIAYSDLLADTNLPANQFFRVYALDPRSPPTRTSGTWDYNAVRHFGAVLDTNATAKGQNLGIDRICYGFGELKCTGTATDAASGFQEIVDANWNTIDDSVAIGSASSARNGILSSRGTTNFIKGKLIIGDDTGTLLTSFTGEDTAFEWEDTYYYDGTRIRPAVGYDDNQNFTGRKTDGSSYYGVEIVGNGTNDTDVTFGAAVGTDQGRSGPSFKGSVTTPTDFIADDGASEAVAIYGTTFENFRNIDCSNNASTDVFRGCTLKRCGTFEAGPVEVRNSNYISSIGGGYTFLETFLNIEAATAEQLSTADPTTEWTDVVNGTDLSVPSDTAGYLELLGGTTRTNVTLLDDDKVGSDDHYAECIVNFPSAGAGQGTIGPVIAGHATNQDYFWVEVDLINDQVELFRVSTGTDNSIAGPTAFTMDEDENYLVLLRRNGTTVEAFISGNSAADGLHTTKLTATDANHTGTAQRLTGFRGDALAGQTGATGERPRMFNFGTGPITDNLGAVLLPTVANVDVQSVNLIQCARGLAVDNTGTYPLVDIVISDNLVAVHNDSNGAVIGSVSGTGTSPANTENLGSASTTYENSVTVRVEGVTEGTAVSVIADETVGTITSGDIIVQGFANSSGVVETTTFNYEGAFDPSGLDVIARARSSGIATAAILDDNAVYTDETEDMNTFGSNVSLLPATPVVNQDGFIFGHHEQFTQLKLDLTTAGTGGFTITWQYWNGAWTSLTGVTDGTSSLTQDGVVSWTLPGDWATTTFNSQGPFYYVRALYSAGTVSTVPVARKTTLDVTRYLPFVQNRTITSDGLTVISVWVEDTISNFGTFI